MIGAMVSSLQECPKRLHTVNVSVFAHIFTDPMSDGFVIKRDSHIPAVFIRIDDCLRVCSLLDEIR